MYDVKHYKPQNTRHQKFSFLVRTSHISVLHLWLCFIIVRCIIYIYFIVLQWAVLCIGIKYMTLYVQGDSCVIGRFWDSSTAMPEMTDGMQSTWLGRETMLYWIQSILAILGKHGLKRGIAKRFRQGLNRRTGQFYCPCLQYCHGHGRARSKMNF